MAFSYVTEPGPINAALFQVTHGLYILTTKNGDRINGQCLDALMQVTNAPPRVVIGVGNKSLTHDVICKSGQFGISVLDRENPACSEVIKRFGFQSGHDVDKFADFVHELSDQGIPFLPDAVAVYTCTVISEKTVDLGTHSLFIASVDSARTRGDGEPLTYNEYRNTLRKKRS